MENVNLNSKYGQLRLFSSNANDSQVYSLQPGINSIGSDIEATLRIYGRDIQPFHCFIEVHENRLATINAASFFYPTKLNKKNLNRNKSEILKSSDIIELGGTQIIYENVSLTKEDIIQGSKIIPKLTYFCTPQKLSNKADKRFTTIDNAATKQFGRTRLTNMMRKKSLSSPAINCKTPRGQSAKKQNSASTSSNIPQFVRASSVKLVDVDNASRTPIKTPARFIKSTLAVDNAAETPINMPAHPTEDDIQETQHSNVSKSLFKTPGNLIKSKTKNISIVDLVTPQSAIKTKKRYPTTPRLSNKLQISTTSFPAFDIKEISESSIAELISDTENSDVLERSSDDNASSTDTSSFEYIGYLNESCLLEKSSDIDINISSLKCNLDCADSDKDILEKCEGNDLVNNASFTNFTEGGNEELVVMPSFESVSNIENLCSDKNSLVEITDDSVEYSTVLSANYSDWLVTDLTSINSEDNETSIELENVSEFCKYNLQHVQCRNETSRTPRTRRSSNSNVQCVSGIKKTPKIQKSPENDLRDVKGVKRLLKTPRLIRSPKNDLRSVTGVKRLMRTPKHQKSPKNDLQDVEGVKVLMKTPRVRRSPANDLQNVSGVKQLMKTPKVQSSPENDFQNVSGIKPISVIPERERSPENDLQDARETKQSPNTSISNLQNDNDVKQLLKTPMRQSFRENYLRSLSETKQLTRASTTHRSSKSESQSCSERLTNTPKCNASDITSLIESSPERGKVTSRMQSSESESSIVSRFALVINTPNIQQSFEIKLQEVEEIERSFRTSSPKNDMENAIEAKNIIESPEIPCFSRNNSESFARNSSENVVEIEQDVETSSTHTNMSFFTTIALEFSGENEVIDTSKEQYFQNNSGSDVEVDKITNILSRRSSSVDSLESVEQLVITPITCSPIKSQDKTPKKRNFSQTSLENITKTPSSMIDDVQDLTDENSPENNSDDVRQLSTTSRMRKSQRNSLPSASEVVQIGTSDEHESLQDNLGIVVETERSLETSSSPKNCVQYANATNELTQQNSGDGCEDLAATEIETSQERNSPRSTSNRLEEEFVADSSDNPNNVDCIISENNASTEPIISRCSFEAAEKLPKTPNTLLTESGTKYENNLENVDKIHLNFPDYDGNKLTNILLARSSLSNDLEGAAGADEQLAKTPKTGRSCERKTSQLRQSFCDGSKATELQTSLKNDLQDVRGVKELMRTPRAQRSPKNNLEDVTGVKRLLRTPRLRRSVKNDLQDVTGVRRLLRTPKVQKSPKNDLRDVAGVKRLMETPKRQRSPLNSLEDVVGVEQLMKTPRTRKSPNGDLQDVVGVKRLMKTPKVRRFRSNYMEDLTGVRRLLETPRVRRSPKNDLRDVAGVKGLMKTPIKRRPPQNNLEDVAGVRGLLKTPKAHRSPRNSLENVSGIKRLFQTPRSSKNYIQKLFETTARDSSKNTLEDDAQKSYTNQLRDEEVNKKGNNDSVEDVTAFDMLKEQKPLRTYRGKSLSPIKVSTYTKMRSSLGSSPSMSPNVFKWVKDHDKYFAPNTVTPNTVTIDEVCVTTQKLSINEYRATPTRHSKTKQMLNIDHTKKNAEPSTKTPKILRDVQNKMLGMSKMRSTTKRLTNNFDDLVLDCNLSKDFMERVNDENFSQSSTPKKTQAGKFIAASNKITHEKVTVSDQFIPITRASTKRVGLNNCNDEGAKIAKISGGANVESDAASGASEHTARKTRSGASAVKDDGNKAEQEAISKTKRTRQNGKFTSTTKSGKHNIRSSPIVESEIKIDVVTTTSDSESTEETAAKTKRTRKNVRLNSNDNTSKIAEEPISKPKRTRQNTASMESVKILAEPISKAKRTGRHIKRATEEDIVPETKRGKRISKSNSTTVDNVEEPISKPKRTRSNKASVDVLAEPISKAKRAERHVKRRTEEEIVPKIEKVSTTVEENDTTESSEEPVFKTRRTRQNTKLNLAEKSSTNPPEAISRTTRSRKNGKSNVAVQDDDGSSIDRSDATIKNKRIKQNSKLKQIESANNNTSMDSCEIVEELTRKTKRTRQNGKLNSVASTETPTTSNELVSKTKRSKQHVHSNRDADKDETFKEPITVAARARRNAKLDSDESNQTKRTRQNVPDDNGPTKDETVSQTRRARTNVKVDPAIKNDSTVPIRTRGRQNTRSNPVAVTNDNTPTKSTKRNNRNGKLKPVADKDAPTQPVEISEKSVAKVGRPKKNVTFDPVVNKKSIKSIPEQEVTSRDKRTRRGGKSSPTRSSDISKETIFNVKGSKNNTDNGARTESSRDAGRAASLRSGNNGDGSTTSLDSARSSEARRNTKETKSSVVKGKRKWESCDTDDDDDKKQNIANVKNKKIRNSLDRSRAETPRQILTRSQLQKKSSKR